MENQAQGKEFTVTLPAKWLDRSMLVWSAPASSNDPTPPNVIVARDYLPEDMTLNQYVNEQVKRLLNHEENADVEQHSQIEWHGKPAVELVVLNLHKDFHTKQRQIYVMPEKGQLLQVSFTAKASEYHNYQTVFDEIEQSFSWK